MSKTISSPPSATLVAGKYQLLGIIGRGGMGSVWEGRHVSLGTRVAIKFIEKEYAESKEARARFDNEARAAATIQSKHAIQIFDHGVTDDGKPYIVMELLQGEGLDKRLERVRRMSLQDTSRILTQVCRALQRAHDGGIVHRDLKPENIFLVRTPDDDDEIAKVLDFGIAKIRGPAGQQLSNSTKTGAVLGTPYYMSPEQARGLRDVDHRTDLWSLAVIVFRCATGVLPFDGESLGDLLVKICTMPLPVPSQVLPGLPPAFDAWFARALDRDPQRRFATANEMADALAYACGMSVKRGPSSSMDPAAMGQARTVASVPPPPGGMTPQPGYGSQPGFGQGSQGGYQQRPSFPGGTPPQAAYGISQSAGGPGATSAPFTASTPRARGGSAGIFAAVGVVVVLAVAGVLYKVTRPPVAAVVAGPGTATGAGLGGATLPVTPSASVAAIASVPTIPSAIASEEPSAVNAGAPKPTTTHATTTTHTQHAGTTTTVKPLPGTHTGVTVTAPTGTGTKPPADLSGY